MTVSYTGSVANTSFFGVFSTILLRWRGSLYKLVFKELLAYILAYFVINLTYRMVLLPNTECDPVLPSCQRWKYHRQIFEALRLYCNKNLKSVPLTFMLGFYVSLIVTRWWKQYVLLPWPDSFGMLVTGLYNPGLGDQGRLMRRNIIRYITLSYCIALRTVSFRLKKRFPTIEHLVDVGIMREDELHIFRELDARISANKWFLPLVWVAKMIGDGVEDGSILPPTAGALMKEVCRIRQNLQTVLSYDWLSVPLVYTQTVTLATYFYFAAALLGSQWVIPDTEVGYRTQASDTAKIDLIFPFFVMIQFVFFVGWLKVAETLINPFGEDDDDFELNRLIDRHIQVGFLITDPTVPKPDLLKDKFWDEVIPTELPYTLASEIYKAEEFKGSAELSLGIKDEDKLYSDSPILYDKQGKTNLKRRRFSKETVYESIRTTVSKNTFRELIQNRKNISSNNLSNSSHSENDLRPSPTQLSYADIREAYGLV